MKLAFWKRDHVGVATAKRTYSTSKEDERETWNRALAQRTIKGYGTVRKTNINRRQQFTLDEQDKAENEA